MEMQSAALEEREAPRGRVIDTSSDWLSRWATGSKGECQRHVFKDKIHMSQFQQLCRMLLQSVHGVCSHCPLPLLKCNQTEAVLRALDSEENKPFTWSHHRPLLSLR